MRSWVLWALTVTAAHAGVPVALPASETADRWHDAFDVAGLEVAVDRDRADVRIEAGDGYWRLVALQYGSPMRAVTVQAPTHEEERLEVAFLARALSRSIEPSEAPDLAIEAPPPAVPEWFAPVAPPPAPLPVPVEVVEPDAEPKAPVIEVVEPEPAEPEPEPAPEPAPEPEPPPVPEAAPPVPEPESDRERRRRELDLRYPPLALSAGGAWRGPVTAAAAEFGLQIAVGRTGPFLWAADAGATTDRRMFLVNMSEVFRNYNDLRFGAAVTFELTRIKPELLAGVARRAFSQENRLVQEMIAPYAGAGIEVNAGGAFAPGLRVRGLADLRGMQFVDADGRRASMSRFDFSVAFVVRIRPSSDPFRPAATPTQR